MASFLNCNELPFKVELKEIKSFFNGNITEEVTIIKQFTQCKDTMIEEISEVKELHELYISFKVDCEKNNDTKLYMDIFDILEDVNYDEDINMSYILSGTTICLYKQRNGDRSYPIVPGIYRIIVKIENDVFYSYIKVNPLHLYDNELDIIKFDIERVCKGLARDIVIKGDLAISDENSIDNIIKSVEIDKLNLLLSNASKIKQILIDIVNNPYNELKNEYCITSTRKKFIADEKSIRWLQSSKGIAKNNGIFNKPNMILSKQKIINTQVELNIIIRNIIKDFLKIIENAKNELIRYRKLFESYLIVKEKYSDIYQYSGEKMFLSSMKKGIIRIDEFKSGSEKLQSFFYEIITKEPFKSLNYLKKVTTPSVVTIDKRYNYIYRLYSTIKDKSNIESNKSFVNFQWKYTDVLYEYWCYITTISTLEMCGYRVEDGWLNDIKKCSDIVIPYINENEQVVMKKDNIKLIIGYNETFETHNNEAIDNNKSIWALSSHNKPDIHIAVFKHEKHKYSILLDSKYRNPRYFWNSKDANRHKYNDTMEQLIDYSTKYYFVDNDDDGLRRPAIKKVIALCPLCKNKSVIEDDKESNIAIMCLNPSFNLNYYREYLNNLIK